MEGWLAGLVSAGGGPGLSSSLLPVCPSVGLKEGEPSPASHAWFPLIDARCRLPFMLGRCGDLVTHRVVLTLKPGMGGASGLPFLFAATSFSLPAAGGWAGSASR